MREKRNSVSLSFIVFLCQQTHSVFLSVVKNQRVVSLVFKKIIEIAHTGQNVGAENTPQPLNLCLLCSICSLKRATF